VNKKQENTGAKIHWAIKGVLACSERPGYPNHTVPARTVDQWLEAVGRLGIRSVINMLSEEEMAVYYRHLESPLVQYYIDAGLAVQEVAHEDLGVVVPQAVLLDRVRAAFEVLPKPVLVHCSAGAERSKIAVEAIRGSWKPNTRKPRGQRR
jgi:protein-tyrosine phosphatase